jgi:hypothetical protein
VERLTGNGVNRQPFFVADFAGNVKQNAFLDSWFPVSIIPPQSGSFDERKIMEIKEK